MHALFSLTSGPKLYKEPSAKSNKHIIQNALAHCCLAGKVNEGQKNKILDVCLVFCVCVCVCMCVCEREHLFISFYFRQGGFSFSLACVGLLVSWIM